MPTAEQAMMRMLLVCLFVCLRMSGCLPSCLAACVGFVMWCVGTPPGRPALSSAAPTATPARTQTHTTPSLLQDSGVDNAASLSAHEMMERVTQQVNHCAPNIAKTRLDQFMG